MSRIYDNLNLFVKYFLKGISSLFALTSGVLLLYPKEMFGINSNCKAFLAYLAIGALALLWAIGRVFFYKENRIYSDVSGELVLRYDDIWKIAFPKQFFWNKNDKKIVVVGVNTSFDTIVDEDISMVKNPLVSPATLHGQWIKQMQEHGVSVEEINQSIHESLTKQGIQPLKRLDRSNKTRGNLDCYERGTIAVYRYNNTFFYLLALAEFDEENKAQNTENKLIKTIEKLIEYYDTNGQGYDLYVPLLGTGRSRTDISPEDALQIMVSYFKIYKSKVKGKVKIIVYKKQRNKVSLDV